MSLINHVGFGALTVESSAEEHKFEGTVEMEDFGETRILITGEATRPVEEIIDEAAASLAILRARENEFRRKLKDTIVTSDLLEIVSDGEERSVSREEVESTFSNILLIKFCISRRYTSTDKKVGYVEIAYEDVEGFIGYDSRVIGDLSFEEYRVEEGV